MTSYFYEMIPLGGAFDSENTPLPAVLGELKPNRQTETSAETKPNEAVPGTEFGTETKRDRNKK